MFALLTMWQEVFNPWVRQCNTDKTDCHVLWRKSKTAYAGEDQTLVKFLTSHQMWEETVAAKPLAANKVASAPTATS